MKVTLNLKNIPTKDDILVFDGEKFVCTNKNNLISGLVTDIYNINQKLTEIEELKQEIKILKGEE